MVKHCLMLGEDVSDKQAYNSNKAAKDLVKVVKSLPETYDNHHMHNIIINGLPNFSDSDSRNYNSEMIETLYKFTAQVVSQKITPDGETKTVQNNIFKQLLKDAGY